MRMSLEGLPDVAVTEEPAEADAVKEGGTDGDAVREESMNVVAEVVEEIVATPVEDGAPEGSAVAAAVE